MGEWYNVGFQLEAKQCFERSKTGRCNHINRKGKQKGMNPCDVTQRMIDAISNGFSTASPDEVLDHLRSKRCKNQRCNHKGCANIDNAIAGAENHMAAMKLAS